MTFDSQDNSRIEITRRLDRKDWRAFVYEHPQGNVFHTPEMFDVFAQAKGHQPNLWAACGGGKVQALLAPVQLTMYGGPLRVLTTRLVAYGGILSNTGSQAYAALKALLREYTRHTSNQALFTELRNLSDGNGTQQIMTECGFRYEDHLDYLIDLTGSPEDVMQRIGPRTRKHIRQGLRKGKVQVGDIVNRDEIETCYGLLKKTYAAAGVPLADISLFEAAYDVLAPKGMVKFSLAKVDGTAVATSVELLYKDVMYGWYGGLDRDYAEHLPGELLMWHLLKWGAENNYRVYDFGGAGRPGETYRVRDFKAKFGGQLVCYGRNTCVHSPLLYGVSTQSYRLIRTWNRYRTRRQHRENEAASSS